MIIIILVFIGVGIGIVTTFCGFEKFRNKLSNTIYDNFAIARSKSYVDELRKRFNTMSGLALLLFLIVIYLTYLHFTA